MIATELLRAEHVGIATPEGRLLVADLTMSMGQERVALIGRNGVGKSSLLEVLSGVREPDKGRVMRRAHALLVPQILPSAAVQCSRGELRMRTLRQALAHPPELLLLDEPSQDLSEQGISWFIEKLRQWPRGLLVASHNPRVLREFRHFFVIDEAGCRYHPGCYEDVVARTAAQEALREQQYLRTLTALDREETRNDLVRRRRRRKQNGGRVREIDRAPSRAMLNSKRSYAQESQGKRARLQDDRIASKREWAKATRRALAVKLPLEVVMPSLPPESSSATIVLEDCDILLGGRCLFRETTLRLARERLAVTGANGAGKTTLLRALLGDFEAEKGEVIRGTAVRELSRIGAIDQGATSWIRDESVRTLLASSSGATSAQDLAAIILAHKFPMGLAERPMRSLSPGERFRAALISLVSRRPAIEMLILDEPTCSLDSSAMKALAAVLRAWPGGLIVASHDRRFLDEVGFDEELALGSQSPPHIGVSAGAFTS